MAFTVYDHEKPAFEEFREVMKNDVQDERTLVRFLRARNLDVRKAESMLRKSLEWRDSNSIEEIRKWELPPLVAKELRMYYCGTDAEKRPVYLMPIGRWDGRKVINNGHKEDACKFMYKILETILAKCKEQGVSQFHVIVDYAELTFWKVAHWDSIENVVRVTREFEANYPETLFSAHFVNAPSVFWQAFKAVKPILAQNTMDKIHIFDSDKKRWTEHLLQMIPEKTLPKDYGGTGTPIDFFPTYAEL